MPEAKKKVVYLLGAGASHAILKYLDEANQGILMSHIAESVLGSLEEEDDLSLRELCNIPDYDNEQKYADVDIESIITLYEASGTGTDKLRTNKLRYLFRSAVNQRIKKAISSHAEKEHLIDVLIDMHSIDEMNEELTAILTMNYDNIIEKSLMKNHGRLNLPFEAISADSGYVISNQYPMLCKLHGSFNWENANPVVIDDTLLDADEPGEDKILWIPPGVIKNNNNFPFTAIWSAARYCLNCDILRIIGCSFNTNDWSVISLLHTTNRLRQDNITYEIECIDYPSTANAGKKKYPYLNIKSLVEIKSFIDYVKDDRKLDFSGARGSNDDQKIESWLNDHSVNIFELWLDSMAYDLMMNKDIDIANTKEGFLQKFYSR